MYRVSGKQIVALAFFSALITAVIVACAGHVLERHGGAAIEPVAIADPSVATDEQNNIEIYRSASPGVVNITNKGLSQSIWGVYPSEGTGSGSIIDAEGHILTNYHVIQNASQLEVQIENDKYPAHVVGADRDNDLAIIQADAPRAKLTLVKLGTSQGLQVGQKVLAIGNPFGLQRTMTTGIISGLERPLRDSSARRTIEGAIQTDASINPGNSGGPLLNSRGEMIGINTAIYSAGGEGGGSIGIGFAIPIDAAKKIIPELISKGYVVRPWLGITQIPLDRRIAQAFNLPVQEGLIVGDVYPNTGASTAGLKGVIRTQSVWGVREEVGDIITAVDGQPVKNNDDLGKALNGKQPGQAVRVSLIRAKQPMTVLVKLVERPRDER